MGRVRVTLGDLAEEYLAQHDDEPEARAKLRWLLTKSTAAFGSIPLTELDAREIAAWRMTLPTGHRFEATQALRQTLARAVEWRLIDTDPAKTGVDNPQPPRREMRPFDSDGQLEALAAELGPRYGPMVLFAAATGLRPGEWIALEHRDIDLNDRLVLVCRAFRVNRLKPTKTNTARAVPLQRTALDALDQLPSSPGPTSVLFPAPEGGYLDLHNWRPRHWRPAQRAASITPTRRLSEYADLTCATRSPPSRCAPDSAPTSSRATWAPASSTSTAPTPTSPATATPRPPAARRLHSGCRHVDAGGRSVDVESPFTRRSPPRRKHENSLLERRRHESRRRS
jgi:integrase